ncbi:MAG: hypothetical protein NTX17_10570 [Candidatus Eisenbacteria bacterium]|nr:hypothetical protein [Candidatus Eisenbacteria bacterium]
MFFNLVSNDGEEMQRIARNFFSENWDHFAAGTGKYLKDWPVAEPIDRQRALFQLLELMVGTLFTSEGHVELITKMSNFLAGLAAKSRPALLGFVDDALSQHYLSESRQTLVEIILRFLERADDFRSVLPFWNPADPDAVFPSDLTVTAPRSFHELKSLYVDAYEAVARALTVVSALANLDVRGHHDNYLTHPILGKKFAPQSMGEFHKKSHAPKLAYLAELPWLERWILPALEPKLRNAIGHNSSRYDATTGDIEYQLDGASGFKSISYGDFLFSLLRLVRSALQLAHLMKQLYVHHYFRNRELA